MKTKSSFIVTLTMSNECSQAIMMREMRDSLRWVDVWKNGEKVAECMKVTVVPVGEK